jgi:hypothetical protein
MADDEHEMGMSSAPDLGEKLSKKISTSRNYMSEPAQAIISIEGQESLSILNTASST